MNKCARCLMSILALLIVTALSAGIAQAKLIQVPFNPDNFVSFVDNPYFPLTPGTTFVYKSQDGDELTIDRFTVTEDTREILGVACIVVHDVVETNGLIIEDTLDFHAQDNLGNVWYFGEETTEFIYDEEGNQIGTSTEGSWLAGVDGALPGIIMLAHPRPGLSYRQELAPGIAEDMALVLRLNARVSVPFGNFTNCLMTKEWSPLERGAVEQKFYAPGIGLVLVIEHHGKIVKVKLVEVIVG